MKLVKKIMLWIVVAFLGVIVLGTIPSFAGLAALITILLIAPIRKWQFFLSKYVKGKIKSIAVVASIVFMFATFPATDVESTSVESSDPKQAISNQTTNTPSTSEDNSTQNPDNSVDEATKNPESSDSTESTESPESTESTESTESNNTSPPDKEEQPDEETITTQENPPSHTHSFISATCIAPKTCSCGATEGSAIGHNWKEASCSNPKTCTVCGTTEGNSKGHIWKDATCTDSKRCTTCGVTEGSSQGHTWKDATCSSPKTCTACGLTEGSTTNHTWIDATYTAPKTCTICSATEGQTKDIPGKENYHGHVYTGGSSSEKYHYEEKCPGKNSHEITWEEVDKRGLGPCGTCVLK